LYRSLRTTRRRGVTFKWWPIVPTCTRLSLDSGPPSHRPGPPAAPRANEQFTSAFITLYLPQTEWAFVRFQLIFTSPLCRLSTCVPEAKKLDVAPDWFGGGIRSFIFRVMALCRLKGTRLPANWVRPRPSAAPVAGS